MRMGLPISEKKNLRGGIMQLFFRRDLYRAEGFCFGGGRWKERAGLKPLRERERKANQVLGKLRMKRN